MSYLSTTHTWIALALCLTIILTACVNGQAPAVTQDTSAPATSTITPDPAATTQFDASNNSLEQGQNETEEAVEFSIVSEGTEARFIIDEVLMGNAKTVVGVTSQVSGDILVNPVTPSASQVGRISINARDLKTDSSRRNRAIQRQVLLTAKEEYQFITFQPTSIENLPEAIRVGDTVSFSVIGDLTILDTTQSETFDMTISVASAQELIGLATTTVLHADYGISIPNVPIVASVEDEVRLELEFVAKTE